MCKSVANQTMKKVLPFYRSVVFFFSYWIVLDNKTRLYNFEQNLRKCSMFLSKNDSLLKEKSYPNRPGHLWTLNLKNDCATPVSSSGHPAFAINKKSVFLDVLATLEDHVPPHLKCCLKSSWRITNKISDQTWIWLLQNTSFYSTMRHSEMDLLVSL